MITDTCEELRELFPDAVLHYETKEEFDECVRRVAEDYEAIRMKAQEAMAADSERIFFWGKGRTTDRDC